MLERTSRLVGSRVHIEKGNYEFVVLMDEDRCLLEDLVSRNDGELERDRDRKHRGLKRGITKSAYVMTSFSFSHSDVMGQQVIPAFYPTIEPRKLATCHAMP